MHDLMSSSQSPNPMSNVANSSTIQSLKQTNPKAAKFLADYKQIILELRAQNFDVIRFATYRTASKLRFIQKKLNLHLIDLWNVIETFRDNNIHMLDLLHELDAVKLEACIQNMYIELNKRLAFSQHINVETQTQLLTAWLLNLYDKQRMARVKVISFKIALTTMCAGKLTDKIKYIFNQVSDPNKNCLVPQKFEIYLKELLVLPTSVFEEPSFGYNENLSRSCFDMAQTVKLNDFLNVALSDLGPACFIWLNIFHRFTVVQNVQHPVTCSVCQRSHFNGFRYKCQKCRKYQLCQDCFWRGRVSGSHQLTHQMKEYTSYKSAAKQFSNTLKKSFFCKPNNKQTRQQQEQQQQLLQQERQSFTQQKPVVENFHQLTYQKQYDYEKALSQQNLIGEKKQVNDLLAAKSTSQENSSDYNLLYRSEPDRKNDFNSPTPMANDNVYSASSTLNRKTYCVGEPGKATSKTLDLTNIISPSTQYIHETQSSQQINTAYQQQSSHNPSSLKKSKTQPNGPTLQMTKAKQLDAINKFLIVNNVSPNLNNDSQHDEHNIIANYSSLLSEFYMKNPHLASSPTQQQAQSGCNHSVKLKPALKPKPSLDQYQMRTASLQRTTCATPSRLTPKSNAFYNNTYMNGNNTISSKAHKTNGLSMEFFGHKCVLLHPPMI